MSEQCIYCANPVNPYDVSTFKQVTGWVGGPKKDHMVLREDTHKYACPVCIKKLTQGQSPKQPSLEESEGDNRLSEVSDVSLPGF